jgi:hypothetical protein
MNYEAFKLYCLKASFLGNVRAFLLNDCRLISVHFSIYCIYQLCFQQLALSFDFTSQALVTSCQNGRCYLAVIPPFTTYMALVPLLLNSQDLNRTRTKPSRTAGWNTTVRTYVHNLN